jgi:hypothetical protein
MQRIYQNLDDPKQMGEGKIVNMWWKFDQGNVGWNLKLIILR